VTHIAAGGFHTLALTSNHELYAWGSSKYGECGNGKFGEDVMVPQLVKLPKDERKELRIKAIEAGGHHSMILSNNGRLFTFGYGQHGQLGLRSNTNFSSPKLVKDLLSKPIAKIAAGWNHTLALTERGDLFACGYG
jgi:alpha-tubulin suppressor-like RCC1 family protein